MASQFASVVQEGYLLIKKNGILKSWTRRWFVLDSTTLTYYKNHSDVGIKFSKQVGVDAILEVIPPDVSNIGRDKPLITTTDECFVLLA